MQKVLQKPSPSVDQQRTKFGEPSLEPSQQASCKYRRKPGRQCVIHDGRFPRARHLQFGLRKKPVRAQNSGPAGLLDLNFASLVKTRHRIGIDLEISQGERDRFTRSPSRRGECKCSRALSIVAYFRLFLVSSHRFLSFLWQRLGTLPEGKDI